MPRKKKIVLEPAGKTLKGFQGTYAYDWKKIVDSPQYQAAIQFLRNRKLESIANLSEEDVDKYAKEIVGGLKGFLQLENEMGKLHEMTDFTVPFEEPDDYISPEQEAEQEQLRAKFREENKKRRYS